ncbi:hypothetical protein [Clostridium sp. SM-530-WT-3G]|uniref:hypothetical protein n=1 Tax=Clostridium sp. SM-530-WT-3G TaxID=2725303 RepID=UPI00145FC234|nr:hypothetical protein [Clostridium sp. SM-530-WT-3G]NME82591.1 hypothetical protein [Clostridium sp. SM-530-WT-3G]
MSNSNNCNCGANKSNNILKEETAKKTSSGCCNKSEGCNDWTSVSQNYDIKDSCEKNEKSAGNNQWCSTSK